jgi:AGCS family alanine or glycine:cation symporter
MGALMQSRSILDIAREGGLSLPPIQAVIVIFTLYFVIFGSEKIKKATYYIIPLTTIIYIFLAVFVVFSNFSRIFDSIIYVLKSAFNFRSAAGGAVGAILKCGFGEGFLRGVMSNEAGAGTSLVGHSAEPGRTAGVAGVFGIFEVVFDTLILCPLTGLVIITSGVPITDSPMGLVNSAFANSFGEGISPLLLLIVFFFAYSTLMSLYYYGAVYSEYLAFPKWIFSVLFVFFIAVSAVFSNAFVTAIDVLLLLMTIPTALCIIKSVGMIKHHTDELLK